MLNYSRVEELCSGLKSSQHWLLLSFARWLVPLGDLETLKKTTFVLKEGVEYKIKIKFRVRTQWSCSDTDSFLSWKATLKVTCCLLQVNKEIVSGLKYIQQSYRKGIRGEYYNDLMFLSVNTRHSNGVGIVGHLPWSHINLEKAKHILFLPFLFFLECCFYCIAF